MAASSTSHPQPEAVRFNERPHRTFVALSIPVLFSLVAEPVTGLVDTAFVAQLGAEALAGLGVGTIVLSGVFWAFNFLGIGTQTEVAQAFGGEATARARQITGLAMALGVGIG
ncbi:MAG: MATE family efflux transporter, partial [Bacteroidota bacterium]